MMATAAPLRRPATAPGREAAARHLHAVTMTTAPRRRPRIAYALTALIGAVLIGAAQLGLSIMVTQGSYQVQELTQTSRALQWERQSLEDSLAGLDSPQYLAANAAALGMVVDASPMYLRLSDSAVLGASEGAGASSVNALGSVAVPNAVIDRTPLPAAPENTVSGAPVATDQPTDAAPNQPVVGTDAAQPPAATGLPSPATH